MFLYRMEISGKWIIQGNSFLSLNSKFVSPLHILQWTIASAVNYPILQNVLHVVKSKLESTTDLETANALEITGPTPWAQNIHENWRQGGFDPEKMRGFGDIAKQMKDMLILPITAFSPRLFSRYGTMGSKSSFDPSARVEHLWKGTWRPRKWLGIF